MKFIHRSLAPFTGWLAHSLCSLPRGTVEIHESVFTLKTRSTGTNMFDVVTRNTPVLYKCVVTTQLALLSEGVKPDLEILISH